MDVLGVVHDGEKLIPGLLDLLHQLRLGQKEVIFLTNSHLTEQDISSLFCSLGLDNSLYKSIITAGDYFHHLMSNEFSENIFFFLNGEGDGFGNKESPPLSLCDYMVLHKFPKDHEIEPMEHTLLQALNMNIPLICVNSDALAHTYRGVEPRPALISEWYRRMGGVCHTIGKPNPLIFQYAIKHFRFGNASKVIMIGDSFDTDVEGACDAGIDCVWVHKNRVCEKKEGHMGCDGQLVPLLFYVNSRLAAASQPAVPELLQDKSQGTYPYDSLKNNVFLVDFMHSLLSC
jgi:ribonucleotide monophosphatase NagD (HAD superfamily)